MYNCVCALCKIANPNRRWRLLHMQIEGNCYCGTVAL